MRHPELRPVFTGQRVKIVSNSIVSTFGILAATGEFLLRAWRDWLYRDDAYLDSCQRAHNKL